MPFWNRRQSELQDEIQTHIDFEIEENLQRGMSPEEARRAAARKFGNPQLALERSREIWGLLWFERLLHDLRYALRTLKKSPGYTTTVILTLAVGLGATAAIFAVVDSVLLRPIAIPHPQQLVRISARKGNWLPYAQIEALRHHGDLFSAVNAYVATVAPVTSQGSARVAGVAEVTPGFFKMLGVDAMRGRLLKKDDSTAPIVILNHAFWSRRLHGKSGVVGSTLKVNGEVRTIVGILPSGVHFPYWSSGSMVFVPLSLRVKGKGFMKHSSAYVLARMKPGVSFAQAGTESESIVAHVSRKGDARGNRLIFQSYQDLFTGNLQKPLYALLGAVLILLLIACANVANLQLARSMERMEEMQVRSALGASFYRLLQQLITESVLVSFAGALLGGGLAYGAIVWIKNAYGGEYARFNQLALHPVVFLVMAVLALIVGILASLAPAIHIRRQTMASAVAQRTTPRNRVSSVLVALQIALTCVLLVVSGLFVRTFVALQRVPLGFNPHQVTTVVLLPDAPHMAPLALRQTDARLLSRFRALPGVQSATLQSSLPFSSYQFMMTSTTDVSTHPFHKGDVASYSLVSAGFVHASGIHLLRGRAFRASDDGSQAMVVLINQAFVHKFLAGHNPIGVTVKLHVDPKNKDDFNPLKRSMRIVGVVQNELQGGQLGAAFQPIVYVDAMQLPNASGFLGVFNIASEFAIRSPLAQAALRKELRATIHQVAPNMAEMEMQPMEQSITASLSRRRLALRLVASFGAIALLLSAIGIYGVLAYAVTLRRKEIGIRMALGSSRTAVIHLVLKKAAWMVLGGLIPGITGAWFAGRAVQSFLYGVTALDPITEASVALVLLTVATVAASVPAWRAARLDPMEVLRAE